MRTKEGGIQNIISIAAMKWKAGSWGRGCFSLDSGKVALQRDATPPHHTEEAPPLRA